MSAAQKAKLLQYLNEIMFEEEHPLVLLYNKLHALCIAVQMNLLHRECKRLQSQFGSDLEINYEKGTCLNLKYWLNSAPVPLSGQVQTQKLLALKGQPSLDKDSTCLQFAVSNESIGTSSSLSLLSRARAGDLSGPSQPAFPSSSASVTSSSSLPAGTSTSGGPTGSVSVGGPSSAGLASSHQSGPASSLPLSSTSSSPSSAGVYVESSKIVIRHNPPFDLSSPSPSPSSSSSSSSSSSPPSHDASASSGVLHLEPGYVDVHGLVTRVLHSHAVYRIDQFCRYIEQNVGSHVSSAEKTYMYEKIEVVRLPLRERETVERKGEREKKQGGDRERGANGEDLCESVLLIHLTATACLQIRVDIQTGRFVVNWAPRPSTSPSPASSSSSSSSSSSPSPSAPSPSPTSSPGLGSELTLRSYELAKRVEEAINKRCSDIFSHLWLLKHHCLLGHFEQLLLKLGLTFYRTPPFVFEKPKEVLSSHVLYVRSPLYPMFYIGVEVEKKDCSAVFHIIYVSSEGPADHLRFSSSPASLSGTAGGILHATRLTEYALSQRDIEAQVSVDRVSRLRSAFRRRVQHLRGNMSVDDSQNVHKWNMTFFLHALNLCHRKIPLVSLILQLKRHNVTWQVLEGSSVLYMSHSSVLPYGPRQNAKPQPSSSSMSEDFVQVVLTVDTDSAVGEANVDLNGTSSEKERERERERGGNTRNGGKRKVRWSAELNHPRLHRLIPFIESGMMKPQTGSRRHFGDLPKISVKRRGNSFSRTSSSSSSSSSPPPSSLSPSLSPSESKEPSPHDRIVLTYFSLDGRSFDRFSKHLESFCLFAAMALRVLDFQLKTEPRPPLSLLPSSPSPSSTPQENGAEAKESDKEMEKKTQVNGHAPSSTATPSPSTSASTSVPFFRVASVDVTGLLLEYGPPAIDGIAPRHCLVTWSLLTIEGAQTALTTEFYPLPFPQQAYLGAQLNESKNVDALLKSIHNCYEAVDHLVRFTTWADEQDAALRLPYRTVNVTAESDRRVCVSFSKNLNVHMWFIQGEVWCRFWKHISASKVDTSNVFESLKGWYHRCGTYTLTKRHKQYVASKQHSVSLKKEFMRDVTWWKLSGDNGPNAPVTLLCVGEKAPVSQDTCELLTRYFSLFVSCPPFCGDAHDGFAACLSLPPKYLMPVVHVMHRLLSLSPKDGTRARLLLYQYGTIRVDAPTASGTELLFLPFLFSDPVSSSALALTLAFGVDDGSVYVASSSATSSSLSLKALPSSIRGGEGGERSVALTLCNCLALPFSEFLEKVSQAV